MLVRNCTVPLNIQRSTLITSGILGGQRRKLKKREKEKAKGGKGKNIKDTKEKVEEEDKKFH